MGGLPWGIECNRLASNATSFTHAIDALGFLVASGRCDVGIIGAAQVDQFGNVNTTGIWRDPLDAHYRPPDTRLTGAGGANDIACGAKRVIIMVSHEPKRFVERVSYISSPGYLDGGNARDRDGFVGGGPSAIITTLGLLRPDPVSKVSELSAYFPFSSVEAILAHTGWDLRVASTVHEVAPPSPAELAALRQVDVTGMLRRDPG